MANYRRFNAIDWEAYAGAEPFSKNKDPFIYERDLNNGWVQLTIIADKNGIEIHLYSCEEDDEDNVWMKEFKSGMTSLRAEGELKHLIEYLGQWDYAPDIAYELDHSPSNGFHAM